MRYKYYYFQLLVVLEFYCKDWKFPSVKSSSFAPRARHNNRHSHNPFLNLLIKCGPDRPRYGFRFSLLWLSFLLLSFLEQVWSKLLFSCSLGPKSHFYNNVSHLSSFSLADFCIPLITTTLVTSQHWLFLLLLLFLLAIIYTFKTLATWKGDWCQPCMWPSIPRQPCMVTFYPTMEAHWQLFSFP